MPHILRVAAFAATLLAANVAQAAPLSFFNAPDFASATTFRATWLASSGIATPQFLVDFETGYTHNQNVHNTVFAGGMVMRDISSANSLLITNVPGSIGGSNPVGSFAVRHNEQPFLELDFSASTVDYFGARDIDQFGSSVQVLLEDGTVQNFTLETTGVSTDSAEFFGFHTNGGPRIQRIRIDAAGDGTWGIDNLEYGRVPEPATLALAGLALAGLVASRRRRG